MSRWRPVAWAVSLQVGLRVAQATVDELEAWRGRRRLVRLVRHCAIAAVRSR